MWFVLVALYVLGALVGALGLLYAFKNLAADLVLMAAALGLSASWVMAACASIVAALSSGGPSEAVTFWGYVATGVTLPVGGVYLAFIERSRWGSAAIAGLALTTIFLAYRLPHIWPAGFPS